MEPPSFEKTILKRRDKEARFGLSKIPCGQFGKLNGYCLRMEILLVGRGFLDLAITPVVDQEDAELILMTEYTTHIPVSSIGKVSLSLKKLHKHPS